MGDAFERAKLKVHEVKWDLDKVRSLTIRNKPAVEWVQHITNATYGMIKTDRNQKLLAISTDVINQYEKAFHHIHKALECLDKAQDDLKEYEQVMKANPNVKVSKTPDT